MSKPTDLVQGTLDLLILRVVALEPMHGWAIAQRIRQMSNEQLRVGQSALYPALHKLEQQGWIEAEWALSENNRRAKYYRLTSAGRKALKTETAQWERLSSASLWSSSRLEEARPCAGPERFACVSARCCGAAR
jgi:PadR family transcriptional regulator, regulatory protein PadR